MPEKRRKTIADDKSVQATGKPKKATSASAFHKRRLELLAWMREDPRRALRYVAYAWFQCAKYEGKADHAPMAEVLGALAEATIAALKERNGPRAWARRQQQGRVALPLSKAEAGRELVRRIEGWLKVHKAVRPNESRRSLLLARPTGEELSFVESVLFIVSTDAPGAGWGPPSTRDLGEQEERMIRELDKVTRRLRYTTDHLAIAVLVGWGMPRTKAKDALKHA